MATDRFNLSGKVALVTGGSRGIGRGIALGLAEHGADVAIVSLGPKSESEEVAAQIKKLGRRAWIFQQDLGRVGLLAALVDRVWKRVSRIDILVNNAGAASFERVNQITIRSWRRIINVNLEAPFFLSQAVSERMIGAGIRGRIINISSTNGLVAEAGFAHYNASKGGLELLTQTLAIELGEHGITVNTIAPGMIVTDIHISESEMDRRFSKYFNEHIPLEHRLGTVGECVGAAIYLASPAGAYTTGQHIVVDGGLLAEQCPRLRFMKPYQNTRKTKRVKTKNSRKPIHNLIKGKKK